MNFIKVKVHINDSKTCKTNLYKSSNTSSNLHHFPICDSKGNLCRNKHSVLISSDISCLKLAKQERYMLWSYCTKSYSRLIPMSYRQPDLFLRWTCFG